MNKYIAHPRVRHVLSILRQASGTRASHSHITTKGTRPTQSTKVRHTPRRSLPHYVSPFVGARYPVQSGQVGAGRSAQSLYPGISPPSPGVRRTFHHPVGSGVPVEARPVFGSKDILLFSILRHFVFMVLSSVRRRKVCELV